MTGRRRSLGRPTGRARKMEQRSWPRPLESIRADGRLVEPIRDQAATRFSERLFELDPSVIALFGGTDMIRQGRMLMQTLATVVAGLDSLDRIVPAIEALGRRRVACGVRPSTTRRSAPHCSGPSTRASGPAFGREDRQAWTEVHGIVAA